MHVSTWFDGFLTAMRALMRDRSGSTAMEYGIVGTLVSIAIVSSLSATGTGVADKWNAFSAEIVSYLR